MQRKNIHLGRHTSDKLRMSSAILDHKWPGMFPSAISRARSMSLVGVMRSTVGISYIQGRASHDFREASILRTKILDTSATSL